MDIRHLQLFRHLSRTLHFAKTSKACHITPSALTRVIQRLEADLGKKLFLRDNRCVELTPAGISFKKYSDDVLERWDILHDQLSSRDILQGKLSLYCSVTAAYGILPAVMTKYRNAHPQVKIHLETGDPAEALTKLSNQDADIVIAALPDILPKDLIFKEILKSPLIFIAPVQRPDIVKYIAGNIDWKQTPLIIPNHGLSRDRIDRWLAKQNFIPNIYSNVAGNEAIIVMVSLGCGIGLVPKMVLEKSSLLNKVNILNITPELPDFTIGLCTRKKNLSNSRVSALWDIVNVQAVQ
ncbi:MAG: HTH-type transcriptional activator IlvY [Desulfobacula sp.]|nr:HTH-type transcriptional activator IlvY [Desulfobacula sp.]